MPQFGNKLWVWVRMKKSRKWIPSFEDVFRIVRAICECEDEKYPNGKGSEMVAEFLVDCCKHHPSEVSDEMVWRWLVLKYQIPERGQEKKAS